ncbi:hypothetical protein [Candidatus Synechococcus spongiarum]|uniref:hypothetical protein n=1 Tax=Candidatus Synechococcus spongiarum TaxID=431041 RepID=UPI0004708F2B|nr:hypothetical protein [Candidatus Synechococcus spongiarum]
MANDGALLPAMEIGIRQDGGDAETGFGLEVGRHSLSWNYPRRGISGELKGHPLLTHMEEEFREQGLALSFAWEPDPSNRGPSLALGHTMGVTTAGGMDALLNPTVLEGVDDASSGGQQFEAQLAYGFPAHNDRLTLSPGVAVALSPHRQRLHPAVVPGALCSPTGRDCALGTLPRRGTAGYPLLRFPPGTLPRPPLLTPLLTPLSWFSYPEPGLHRFRDWRPIATP